MATYGEYNLLVEPLPAQKKNRLVFRKEVVWTATDGRQTTTWDRILEIEVAPLQEELLLKALELFRSDKTKKPTKK